MKTTAIPTDIKILVALLALLGIVLTATTIRGAFIIDEINYGVTVLGLRHGTLMVPGTDQVGPTQEVFFFDPESEGRVPAPNAAAPLAPPLYAPIALPFSVAGWRGLAFLNTLSFLLAAAVVYLLVRRIATEPSTPWLALCLFVLGGYEFEYAQGVWPHMLSVALCMGAIYLVHSVWQELSVRSAVWAGVLFGIACGIREQNIFLAACAGVSLLFIGRRRLVTAASYAGGVALPLAVSSTINFFRLGLWFPAPKAIAYSGMVTASAHTGSWLEPFKVFWVKIIDYSTFALFRDPSVFVDYSREPSTGAYLVAGVVKKSLLQSSPWIALALIIALAAWFTEYGSNEKTRRAIRGFSLLLIPTLAAFSCAGFRTDGLSFNQRYLLELIPVAAVLVALCLDGLSLSVPGVVAGFLVAGLLFAATLIFPWAGGLHVATLRLPLYLAMLLILGWSFRTRPRIRPLLAVAVGLCIGWSLAMEAIDLQASRTIRTRSAVVLDSLDRVLPDHSALFAYWGQQKAAAGPIQFTKNVLILDPWADAGKDAPRLARLLSQQRRRVFVFGTGVPDRIIQSIRGEDSLAVALSNPVLVYEVVPKPGQPGADIPRSGEDRNPVRTLKKSNKTTSSGLP